MQDGLKIFLGINLRNSIDPLQRRPIRNDGALFLCMHYAEKAMLPLT